MKKRLLTVLLIATMTLVTACSNAEVPTENDTTTTTVSVTEQPTSSSETLMYSDEKFNIFYIGVSDNEILFKIRNKTDDTYYFVGNEPIKINHTKIENKVIVFDTQSKEQTTFSIEVTDTMPEKIETIQFSLFVENKTNKDELLKNININATVGNDVKEIGATDKTLLYENNIFSISYDRTDKNFYSDSSKIYFIMTNKTDKSYTFRTDALTVNDTKDEYAMASITVAPYSKAELIVDMMNCPEKVTKIGADMTYFIEKQYDKYTQISIPQHDVPLLSANIKSTEKSNYIHN